MKHDINNLKWWFKDTRNKFKLGGYDAMLRLLLLLSLAYTILGISWLIFKG